MPQSRYEESEITGKTWFSRKDLTGVGIYANGVIEALCTGGNLSASQLERMTTGDASELALGNKMWSYWGENLVPQINV